MCLMYACSVVSTGGKSLPNHVLWPLRNSKVFHSLNAMMERCNDLMELVHAIHDFRYMYMYVHSNICNM